jgi:hypothetical protein
VSDLPCLPERLRVHGSAIFLAADEGVAADMSAICNEAADEIERLERENARLMETAMGLSSARGKL